MAADEVRESVRELNDPPPDYNPRWGGSGGGSSRTARFTSSVGQWLGVVDRNEGIPVFVH